MNAYVLSAYMVLLSGVPLRVVRQLPHCDRMHNGNMVIWRANCYRCDATFGEWSKVSR